MNWIVVIGIYGSFAIAFLSNKNADKIKKLHDIKSLSNILIIDGLFDILSDYYQNSDKARSIVIIYSIMFPITVIINILFPSFKNGILFIFILLLSLIICNTIPYASLQESKSHLLFFSIITLQILSIIACSYKVLSHKRILQPVNYLFYLLLGFLILDFFWYLGYRQVITKDFESFMKYHYFFIYYLTIFRIIYIIYVIRLLKPFQYFKSLNK
jgi:hypothetical protein